MARGSVSDRRDRGRGWEARWYTTNADGSRKQHSKSFKTKAEGWRHVNRMLGDADRGERYDPELGKTSFQAVASEWEASLKSPALKPSTVAAYKTILHFHLIPEFGPMAINRISAGDIHRFLNNVDASPGTKRNILRVLNQVMNHAILDDRISSNPVAKLRATVKLPRIPKGDEPAFLTPAQVDQLANEVGLRPTKGQPDKPPTAHPTYRVLILSAAYTGMRAGELAALRIGDVDLAGRRLRVRESVSDLNGDLILVKPKNGKVRNVSLPSFLADELQPLVEGRRKDAFVFGTDDQPFRHRNFYARHFKPAVRRLVARGDWPEEPLSRLRFHDLRHTAASILIANGEQMKVVSERLGHSSIAITYDRYGHLYEGHDVDVADRLDAMYRQA